VKGLKPALDFLQETGDLSSFNHTIDALKGLDADLAKALKIRAEKSKEFFETIHKLRNRFLNESIPSDELFNRSGLRLNEMFLRPIINRASARTGKK